jgi:hypothetical protein
MAVTIKHAVLYHFIENYLPPAFYHKIKSSVHILGNYKLCVPLVVSVNIPLPVTEIFDSSVVLLCDSFNLSEQLSSFLL